MYPHIYPSKTDLTCPNNRWTGLCIKLLLLGLTQLPTVAVVSVLRRERLYDLLRDVHLISIRPSPARQTTPHEEEGTRPRETTRGAHGAGQGQAAGGRGEGEGDWGARQGH